MGGPGSETSGDVRGTREADGTAKRICVLDRAGRRSPPSGPHWTRMIQAPPLRQSLAYGPQTLARGKRGMGQGVGVSRRWLPSLHLHGKEVAIILPFHKLQTEGLSGKPLFDVIQQSRDVLQLS